MMRASEAAAVPQVHAQAARLSQWTGVFLDPELEQRYREVTRESRLERIRIIAGFGALFYLAGTAVDVLLVGSLQLLAVLLVIRLVVAAALALTAVSVVRLGARVERWMLPLVLLVAVSTSLIIALSPDELMAHALTVVVLLLVIYMFVPLPTFQAMLGSGALSIGFVVTGCLRTRVPDNELVLVLLYLLLGNVLGALANRDLRSGRRREFATVEAQRRALTELEQEMQARRHAEQALVESELRYRSLVELSPYGIVVHREGEVVYVNPTGLRLLAAPMPETVLGRPVFDMISSDHWDMIRARMAQLFRGEVEALPAAEFDAQCLDGTVRRCEVVSGLVPFDGEVAIQSVIQDVSERRRLLDELRRLAITDPLTGISNRRQFFETIEREWTRARRHGRNLTVAMLDLDDFKSVNDQHGHAAGDQALVGFVRIAQRVLRSSDFMARIGGEEFGLVLPETDLEGGQDLAERLRLAVDSTPVESAAGLLHLTASIGVAQCRLDSEHPDDAIRRADDALLLAKRSGRNTIRLAEAGT